MASAGYKVPKPFKRVFPQTYGVLLLHRGDTNCPVVGITCCKCQEGRAFTGEIKHYDEDLYAISNLHQRSEVEDACGSQLSRYELDQGNPMYLN
eukprot:2135796-Amphidinium_carterae.2